MRGFGSLLDPPPYKKKCWKLQQIIPKSVAKYVLIPSASFSTSHFFQDSDKNGMSENDPVLGPTTWKNRPAKNKHFFKKSTSYASSAQSTRTKMTANGFSSYELFVKIDDLHVILQCFWQLFMKINFFVLPNVNIVYRGLCVPTSETSCSSYFMKTDRQKPNLILVLSPQIQDQKNPGPLQTEAQRPTM